MMKLRPYVDMDTDTQTFDLIPNKTRCWLGCLPTKKKFKHIKQPAKHLPYFCVICCRALLLVVICTSGSNLRSKHNECICFVFDECRYIKRLSPVKQTQM